jgi:hypothetical protein
LKAAFTYSKITHATPIQDMPTEAMGEILEGVGLTFDKGLEIIRLEGVRFTFDKGLKDDPSELMESAEGDLRRKSLELCTGLHGECLEIAHNISKHRFFA